MSAEVKCPSCGDAVVWNAQSVYRPFCSQRCKLADLGAWATGQYSVSEPADAGEGADDEFDPD